MDTFDLYLLNLAITVAMLPMLIFRAWVEFSDFKIFWKEMEWQRTRRIAKEILSTEKEAFHKTESGRELFVYSPICSN